MLVTLAALIKQVDPRRRKRIRRATILYMLYLTTFVFAAILGIVHAEGWARRVWFLADLMEVLVIIDFVAILLFDLVLLALRIEVANIVHDLALGAAYILAFIGILHRSGVQLSGIIATSAVVTVVLGLSLQATLGNVLGGIALQLDDSIHIGDWVQLANGPAGADQRDPLAAHGGRDAELGHHHRPQLVAARREHHHPRAARRTSRCSTGCGSTSTSTSATRPRK